jgi:hypothetical protein
MKVNHFYETALNIYKLYPYVEYSYEKYIEMKKIYDKIKDCQTFLIEIGCTEGMCKMILKTISITSSYFFKNMDYSEQEKYSLEFIMLFSINNNCSEFKRERIEYIKLILSLICNKNSNNEISVLELITNLYLIYVMVETFLGTSIIFFSMLSETQNLLNENKFLKFYDDFILSERSAKIDNFEYEQVHYKDLLVKIIGNDNSSQVFKLLVEFFANKKIEASIEDENLEEMILTTINEKFILMPKIDFERLLEELPLICNPKEIFKYLLFPN